MDILDELKKLIGRLNEEKIEYALCGGLAMAVYALPRATLDVDILIEACCPRVGIHAKSCAHGIPWRKDTYSPHEQNRAEYGRNPDLRSADRYARNKERMGGPSEG